LIHFYACFYSKESRWATALGGLEIRHGSQQSLIVVQATHQDLTKQGLVLSFRSNDQQTKETHIRKHSTLLVCWAGLNKSC